MIYDPVNGICRPESHETARAFCVEVIKFVELTSKPHIECEIEGVQFSCFGTDSVEDLLTRYTDRHQEYVDFLECEKRNDAKLLHTPHKQICVRTYTCPSGIHRGNAGIGELNEYLNDGWYVFMATHVREKDTKHYIEYILEKGE